VQLAKKHKVRTACLGCVVADCRRVQSPLIYALSRAELASAVNKPGGASVVTVLYEQGAEVAFKVADVLSRVESRLPVLFGSVC
jgi:hypothetical protein